MKLFGKKADHNAVERAAPSVDVPAARLILRTGSMLGPEHGACRVLILDVDHDPHAKAAVAQYAAQCSAEDPELAKTLRGWLEAPKATAP